METDRIKKAVTLMFPEHEEGDPKGPKWSIARIIVTALVIAGLAWLVFTALRDLIIYGLYFRYVDELAAKTGLNKHLINVLAALGLAPFVVGFKYYFLSWKSAKRKQGAALLLGMIVVYNMALYFATKGDVIGSYYSVTPEGVKYSSHPLDDGRDWQKVTRENMWYVTHLAVGKKVDARGHDWFDQKSGLPLLWYSKVDNEIQFYNGPGYDRFTGEALKAVTKELYLQWRRSAPQREAGPVSRTSAPSSGSDSGAEIRTDLGGGIVKSRGGGYGEGEVGGVRDEVFRAGSDVSAPVPIYRVEPEYSEEARKAKHQGTVLLAIVVDEQGRTRDIRVVRSLGMGLDERAIEAVSKWRFRPGYKNGRAVAVAANIEVKFRLL